MESILGCRPSGIEKPQVFTCGLVGGIERGTRRFSKAVLKVVLAYTYPKCGSRPPDERDRGSGDDGHRLGRSVNHSFFHPRMASLAAVTPWN